MVTKSSINPNKNHKRIIYPDIIYYTRIVYFLYLYVYYCLGENNMNSIDQRKYVRFNPAEMAIAVISSTLSEMSDYDSETSNYTGEFVALVNDESYKGCSLIIKNTSKVNAQLQPGKQFILKLGQLPPQPAIIKWREEIAPGIIRVGMQTELY